MSFLPPRFFFLFFRSVLEFLEVILEQLCVNLSAQLVVFSLYEMVGDSASDGVPLLTRLLLVRATVRFDPSFPSDTHRVSSAPFSLHSGRSPTAATPPYTAIGAIHARPNLRIVAHYAQNAKRCASVSSGAAAATGGGDAAPLPASSLLRRATSTPKEDANFFAAHASLHQLLTSLATDRLSEKVKLRQVQTDVARTAVKLARVTASSPSAAAAAAAAAGTSVPSPDGSNFFSNSFAGASLSYGTPSGSGVGIAGDAPLRVGSRVSTSSMGDEDSQTGTGTSSSNQQIQQQVQGMLAAATATFAEDAAWRSLTTPYRPQLNPWSLMPISDEGCYLSLPSPAYVHWCQLQAARCCASATAAGGSEGIPTEPEVQGGPMQYNDVVHYASDDGIGRHRTGSSSYQDGSCGEEVGYLHGYAFVLDGAVFAGSGEPKEATTRNAPFSENDGEMSVLLWCVLSDAPVFNFMRSLTLEAVAAMSYVAQRTYLASAESATASPSSGPAKANIRADVYTSMLDSLLDEEVVRPLAAELTMHGSASSRTLPGGTFTVTLPLTRGQQSGVSARPQTSSLSGTLTFRRPLDLLFPFADVPLPVLLLSFGEDALRVLQSLLLQEERVVVIGATPQHASACVVSLLNLIAPFTWVSPLVPYLPPHVAAQTGLLYTLLSTPYEQQQQQQQQSQQQSNYSSPVASRPAPYASGVASQSSRQMESAGFLLGSTAGIRPYLILLSAFGVAEDEGDRGGCRRSGRAPRVWIADARTGAVGVCPTEPIAPYMLVSDRAMTPWHAAAAMEEGNTSTNNNNNNGSTTVDRSCTAYGGASAWTLPAYLDLRTAAPQMFTYGPGSGGSRSSSRSPYVVFNAVRNTLRTAAEVNVTDAVPLDMLPPFHDDLCEALHRAAPVEKRRQFRQALEEWRQHCNLRLDSLASLAARLTRGLRHARRASAAAAATAASLADCTRQSSFSVDSIGSYSRSSSRSSNDTDSDDSGSELETEEDTFQLDENASFRAVTQAVAQSSSVAFPDAASAFHVAQFPTLTAQETWQVQSGFLGYVVGRLAGAYRRGIIVVSGASHRSNGRRRYMEASVFLAPGLDQHYALAETVARTHLFRQFECAVLAAEMIGLRRVLRGSSLEIGRSGSGTGAGETGGRSGECHMMMRLVRPLAMFAILCDRARLQFPELYADVPELDAVGMVYATLVERCFAHRPGSLGSAQVPPAIRSIAGSSSAADVNRAAAVTSSSNGTYSSSGCGGGFRGFLSKAAKAMKLHSSSSGSGGNNAGGGGGGGSGGGRGLPVLHIPASVACMNSFAVALFSDQLVAPESFQIITYDTVGPDGAPRRRHKHQRHHSLHQQSSRNDKKAAARRYGKHLAGLYAIPVKPKRQQWARQQQHQQRTAIGIDFTLDDCAAVAKQLSGQNGSNGSMASSFAAASAASAATAGVTSGSVFVSGAGVDAEVLTALARSGGARGGGGTDAAMRVMAETSLSVCHALPLDVVHQFDAYEPLLTPVVSSTASTGDGASRVGGGVKLVTAVAATLGEDMISPVAYMSVGLLCPSCVNVWREGEARATQVLQERQLQAQQRSPSPSPSQRKAVVTPPPPSLPPKPVKTMGASTPLEMHSWSTPPPTPPLHTQLLTRSTPAAAAAAGGDGGTGSSNSAHAAPPASWGAFTSGAPHGYHPIDSTSRSYPANNNNNHVLQSPSAWGNPPYAASQDLSVTLGNNSAPLLAAVANPAPSLTHANAHQDEWENWGVQAPVVVNTPNTAAAAPPPTRSAAAEAATKTTADAAKSMSVNANSNTSGNNAGAGNREMMPSLPSTLMLSSVALPITAPAPGDVMDELFAGLSSYDTGVSGSNSASNTNNALPPQQQQQQPRRQTLDDFF